MLKKWSERDDLREKMLPACLDEREEDAEELVDIKLPEDDSKDPSQLNIFSSLFFLSALSMKGNIFSI